MTYLILSIIILTLSVVILFLRKANPDKEGRVKITNLSRKHMNVFLLMVKNMLPEKSKFKVNFPQPQGFIYVLDFKGGLQAQQVENLREEISAILSVAKIEKPSEVIVKLDSPGGTVNGYGLAASQLARIKKANIPLTIVVDQVAASGGYMMAAVANKIVAAPFSVIGSIGVVMEFPNFSDLLKKIGVEYKQYTAGEYKRTVSPLAKPTEEGEKKTNEKLIGTLDLFKKHIKNHRPNIEIDKVATGETWYGEEAKELGLVDEVMTFEDYVEDKFISHEVFKVEYKKPEKLSKRFSLGIASTINQVAEYWFEKLAR